MAIPLPGSPDNLSDWVASYLVDYIRRNRLPSGAPLPSEVRLASDLKVSRGIIREAYRALKSSGVLDIANGRSPRVGELNRRGFTLVLQHALSTEQASAEQVFDVRSALEVRAAEIAAERRTDEAAETLRREARAIEAAGRHREKFVSADMRFHDAIGRATGNPLFGLIASALRESLDLTIRAGFDSRRSKVELARVAQIHSEIAEAIADRNVARAREMMTVHFDEARHFVLSGRKRKNRSMLRA